MGFFEHFQLSYFFHFPLVIKIAVIFISISIIMILNIQLQILFIRYNGYRKKKRKERIIPIIDNLITEAVFLQEWISLFDPSSIESVELDISRFQISLFQNRRNRQILIDRLISYKTEFSGTIGILLRKLYLDLELNKMSLQKIRKGKWSLKIKGISELEEMDIPISDALLLPLTNSKNHELRSKARNAYIRLSKNEPFKFLDVSTQPLLKWEQIELFKTITFNETLAIPIFASWITYSNNISIISFCLKLIAHFHQTESIPSVLKLLDHKDQQVRLEAIDCLSHLKYNGIEKKLIDIYKIQSLNCQLGILRNLGQMHTKRNISFLKQEFFNSIDFNIRKEAAKSLIQCLSQKQIEKLLEASSPENRLILNHCLNPLISS